MAYLGVSSDYTLATGQTITYASPFGNDIVISVQGPFSPNHGGPAVTIDGEIHASTTLESANLTGIRFGASGDQSDYWGVSLKVGGRIEIAASTGTAIGVQTGSHGPAIVNEASGEIVISGSSAWGYVLDAASLDAVGAPTPLINAGLLQVDATQVAVGMVLDGLVWSVVNSGTIDVHAGNASGALATAIYYPSYSNLTITNSGSIHATVDAPDGIATAILAGGNPGLNLTNHGTIQAARAVFIDSGGTFTTAFSSHIVNDGTITGLLSLGDGRDTVENTGSITGNIAFGTGDDTLLGVGGTITGGIDGGDGSDALYTGGGGQTLHGGAGDDLLDAGPGDDVFDGGAGSDTASFTGAIAVSVDLRLAGAQATGRGSDTLLSIENLRGSDLNDTLHGSVGANVLAGGAGDDLLDGDAGTDAASYALASAGVTVSLAIGGPQAVGGGLGSDTLVGLEGLIGSDFADVLTGNDGANVLVGGIGDDTLNGLGGNDTFDLLDGGDDTVNGGDGNDTIVAGDQFGVGERIDGGAGKDILMLGAADGGYQHTFGPATMVNVESIVLAARAGYDYLSYSLRFDGATVAAGQSLTIDASALTQYNSLWFYATSETDGSYFVKAGAAREVFVMGAAMRSSFHLEGSTDSSDRLELDGDYSAGLTFKALTLTNVESIALGMYHSYRLTMNDGNVAAGKALSIGGFLKDGNVLKFDGSAETDGSYLVGGGIGDDTIAVGLGTDTLKGNNGDDVLQFGGGFAATDTVDGGGGNDRLTLDGDYSAGVVFAATTLIGVESMKLTGGHSYDLTPNDSTVGSGKKMTIDASQLGAADHLRLDGSAEHNGAFVVLGGAGDDTVIGSAGADRMAGGLGADDLTGNGGADSFVYKSANHSSAALYDTVNGFDFAAMDVFDLKLAVAAVRAGVTGAASDATLAADLASQIGKAQLLKHEALLFTATSGDLAGETFLIVDANGRGGYQAADLVVHLDGAVNIASFDLADFV
jgi:Ca2+-binding RTX toxin-like protein